MAATLMIQGTTSDAGKSVMVAGLCRLLTHAGYKVAPFKPQNMALNSAVTVDGGEIGRAQALQAIACNILPHSDMNPILLKPESDKNAQVIVQGNVIDMMPAEQYHQYKTIAFKAVMDSYRRLSQQYDVIIVEGAGSPAEINLRHNDLANMGFAEVADCPVLIVSDIDRGGVFAHLVGTLALLSESEKNRVVGFIINRFRGDINLLLPGNEWLEQHTGKKVVGTVPYIMDLRLDAEDALDNNQTVEHTNKTLTIIVPVLPRISNHTDFDPLKLNPDINFQFVAIDDTIPTADLIILPGSKNVRQDLAALKAHGWDKHISRHLRYDGKLMGICGGFQMLGKAINDSMGSEGSVGSSEGLKLLDIETNLTKSKLLENVKGKLFINNETAQVEGYEIHTGISHGSSLQNPLITFDCGRTDGAMSADNQIIGTYVHGIFDQAVSCSSILKWLGIESNQTIDQDELRQNNLNKLSQCLSEHLDIDYIKQLLKLT